LLYQHRINSHTEMAVWKIEEPEAFFTEQISIQVTPSHPAKRLQHLAGRLLLKKLQTDFPLESIQSQPGQKPFLLDHTYHFSISHSDKIAAAIISQTQPVGIDVEMITDKALRVAHKFLREEEVQLVGKDSKEDATLLWSIKETVFKWYGLGSVDFREDIQVKKLSINQHENIAECFFLKTNDLLNVKFLRIENVVVSWIDAYPPLESLSRILSGGRRGRTLF
jgi:phosphopantetheinyl transferase